MGLTQSHRRTLQQQHEVLLVVASFRIFPVHVQAVKLTVPQERYGAVDESLASVPGCGHHFELLGAEGPPTCKDTRRFILDPVRKLWVLSEVALLYSLLLHQHSDSN